jgi:DNA-binding FadR family transcriptional regulator
MGFGKVLKTSLVDDVARRIRETIERDGLVAGDRLPSESEMLRQLGVSRSVLREALGQLRSIGLVNVQHGRGTYLADGDTLLGCIRFVRSAMTISSRELIQFTEFRAAIESYAARRGAETATEEQLDGLGVLCQAIDAEGLDERETMRRDLEFHLGIVELGGNRLMLDVLRVIQELILEAMVRTTESPRPHASSQEVHSAIVDAMRARDPEAAEAAVWNHMGLTVRRLEELDGGSGQAEDDRDPTT